MKIPEPLFKLINFFVKGLLKSPLHGMVSDSMMIINFTGRVSGKQFSTPVRFLRVGDKIRCTTSKETKWWTNLASNQATTIHVAGKTLSCNVELTMDNDEALREILTNFLAVFPQDAVYQNIKLEADNSLNQEDLAASVKEAVVVDFIPIPTD